MFRAISRNVIDTLPGQGGRKSFTAVLCGAVSIPALLIAATPGASAADLPYKDDGHPAIMTYNGGSWAGFYFGAQAGALVGADNDLASVRSGGNGGDGGGGGAASGPGSVGGAGGNGGGGAILVNSDGDNSDAIVGLHIGYNWQNGNFVYGVETDIDANNSLDTLLGSLRGRLGYASGRSLFYATAGLAYLSIDGGPSSRFVGGAGGAGGTGGSASGFAGGTSGLSGGAGGTGPGIIEVDRQGDSGLGFVAGLGVEYKLTSQVGLGLEGLYYNFGSAGLGDGADGNFFSVSARLTMHLDRDEDGSLKDGYPAIAQANWRGFYIGANAGASFDASDNVIDSVNSNNGPAGQNGGNGVAGTGPTCGVIDICNAGGGGGGGGAGGSAVARLDDDMAFIGGVHLGYNWQNSHWVYGLEGDASFGSDKINYLASARGRLGYASGSYLFYGTAGIAFAGIDGFSGIFANNGQRGQNGGNATANGDEGTGGPGGPGGTAGAIKNDQDLVGFVVGAGVDAKLTDRLSLGLEGLYYGFNGDNKAVPGDNTFAGSDDNNVFVLRTRLSYSLTPQVEPLK